MLFHPIVSCLVIVLGVLTAALGWSWRSNRRAEVRWAHVRLGRLLLIALAVAWLLGLESVRLAALPGIVAGQSGHFLVASLVATGLFLSGLAVSKWGKYAQVRAWHRRANTVLVALLVYQAVLGLNRLYKFHLLRPVPSAEWIRRALWIKFSGPVGDTRQGGKDAGFILKLG